MRLLSLVLVLGTLFTACEPLGVFEQQAFFPKAVWSAQNKPRFQFQVADTTARYHLFAVIRHNDAYRYNNIWVRFTTKAPGDTLRQQLVSLKLADNKKGWLGTGMDDVYEQRVRLSPQPLKLKAGVYVFNLEQMMRDEPLTGILQAGIRLEKLVP